MDYGLWTVDCGLWTVDSKLKKPLCFAAERLSCKLLSGKR